MILHRNWQVGQSGHTAEHNEISRRLLNVIDYGAVGDGIADDTAALQSAIAATGRLPAGTYKTTVPLDLTGGDIHFVGAGQSRTKIVNTTSDVFTGVVTRLRMSDLTIEASGGHIFHLASVSNSHFHDLTLRQLNTTKSVMRYDDPARNYVGNIMERCRSEASELQAVPVFDFISTNGNVNANTWRDMMCFYSGNYMFSIDNATLDNWAYDNRFQDISFEGCSGGSIRLMGCNGVIIDNCHEWDTTVYNRDIILAGQSTGLKCDNLNIKNCGRRGGVLANGVYDMNLFAYTAIIENCGAVPDSTYTLKVDTVSKCLLLNDRKYGTVIPA